MYTTEPQKQIAETLMQNRTIELIHKADILGLGLLEKLLNLNVASNNGGRTGLRTDNFWRSRHFDMTQCLVRNDCMHSNE